MAPDQMQLSSPDRSMRLCFLVVVFCLAGCAGYQVPEYRSLTVLYTNDEHGWMEGVEEGLGAANLMTVWRQQEGYSKDGPFLLLSGGDNWTGPAISTWVEGASMVDLMNTMGYDASAIGNHEFDFGLDILELRASEAHFPYLSANIQWRDTGENLSSIGLLPFTFKEVNGIKVGIIGLTTRSTPMVTLPGLVKDLEFIDYEQAVRETMEQVNENNPDLIFIISHVCIAELNELALRLEDLNINLIGAGHCNELLAQQLGSTVMLGGGSRFTTYAKASFVLDRKGLVKDLAFSTHNNTPTEDDNEIANLVSKWREVSSETFSVSLGFNGEDLERRDTVLQQAIIDSWLIQDPSADIAITNGGGFRTGLAAGEITFGDVFSIMPFDNSIVVVAVPGRVVREVLANGILPVVAGLRETPEGLMLDRLGDLIQENTIYRVLINNFMYEGGGNYGAIAESDPNGFDTGVSYRQPFVDWLQEQGTSSDRPLRLGR